MNNKTRRKRQPWRILLAAGILLILLYIAAVNLLITAVMVPSFMEKLPSFERITRRSYAEQVQETQLQQNASALSAIGRGWSASFDPEILHIQSEDGYTLAAALFARPNTAGGNVLPADGTEVPHTEGTAADAPGSTHRWAVLLHGYTGSREMMYEYAYWYYHNGYQVLVPDLRCQGESEGDYIGMGFTDSRDVLGWLNVILKRDPAAEIVLHGVSMGASTALIMAGMEDLPPGVCAVVADCAYTDAYEMFRYKIWDWFHLPAFPVVDSADFFVRLRAGFGLREASPREAVAHSRVPILFIHGVEDRMIPVAMTEELYLAADCVKEIYPVQGAGHAQAAAKDPAAYYQRVQTFLMTTEKHLLRRSGGASCPQNPSSCR